MDLSVAAYTDTWLVGCVAQWKNVGYSPGELSCPALDLQLTGDHLCG